MSPTNSTEYQREYARRRYNSDPDFAAKRRERNRAYKAGRGRARASERERLRKAGLRATNFHIDPLVVLEASDGICGICNEDVDPMNFQIDHAIPLCQGGEHALYNLQAAHARCNQSKGGR